jgi:electron transfer flavoprotein alpha subunit
MGEPTEEIWVLAEHAEGIVQPVTYEVLAFADKVAETTGGRICVVVVGHPAGPMAGQIARRTGCDVIGVENEAARVYSNEAYRDLIRAAALPNPPRYLFVPHTTTGWDLAPALAVDLSASSLSGVCGFVSEGGPVFHRRILNGKILQDVRPVKGRHAVVTVLPGTESPYVSKEDRPGIVRIVGKETGETKARVLGTVEPPPSSVRLREAEVIVAAGRGVGGAENLACIHELAGLFKRSAVGASRPLCDMGLLPLSCQVGMTGQTVSPRLYIACGISGAVQHTMGMKNADLVVAVNTDRNAPLCREAHYAVVADLHEFVPLLVEKIRAFRGRRSE